MQVGDILKNGATVLMYRETSSERRIVLAIWGREFVTWLLGNNKDTYCGHYFPDLQDALKDYLER